MAWIESHDDVWEHHKTLKLCVELQKDVVAVVGHLHSLWHFVLRNAWRDADLKAWGETGIESAARWSGEKGVMVKALRDCGFLDGFKVHGWIERAGRLVYDRKRKENERRTAERRRTSGGQSKATVPYPTVPNRTKEEPPPKRAFVRPSVEDITAYCKERGNSVKPEVFLSFYESKGWVVGKSPMKDWRAAVRTWEQSSAPRKEEQIVT